MQEDIEDRTVTLMVNSTKFTGRTLKNAIAKLLHHMKNQSSKQVVHHGKQTVKQLIGQDQGVSNIEINDPSIKEFETIARKYGVDFAVKKVKGEKNKYLVFFKGRDADALTAAFTEYTDKRLHKQDRPSVLKLLNQLKAQMTNREAPVKNKELSR